MPAELPPHARAPGAAQVAEALGKQAVDLAAHRIAKAAAGAAQVGATPIEERTVHGRPQRSTYPLLQGCDASHNPAAASFRMGFAFQIAPVGRLQVASPEAQRTGRMLRIELVRGMNGRDVAQLLRTLADSVDDLVDQAEAALEPDPEAGAQPPQEPAHASHPAADPQGRPALAAAAGADRGPAGEPASPKATEPA